MNFVEILSAFWSQLLAGICGIVIGLLSALWITDRARRQVADVEAKLREIQRCKSGPLWAVSDHEFQKVTLPPVGALPEATISSEDPNVLCFSRQDVGNDVAAGTPIYVLVEDLHEDHLWRLRENERGQLVTLRSYKDPQTKKRTWFLQYRFDPVLLRKQMNFKIAFFREGVRHDHLYATTHGSRVLNRVDPPVAVPSPRYDLEEDAAFKIE